MSSKESSSRPCIPDIARRYSSKLDATQGALRTTSDGNLFSETTGDYVILNTPPHDREDREMALQKSKQVARGPAIGLPEAKNGATAFDDPRARKPFLRVLRNKLSGSDRPPPDTEDPAVVERRKLHSDITQVQEKPGKADTKILGEIQKHYALVIGQSLGGDWFEHALIEHKFWLQVLEKVLEQDPV